MTTLEMFQELMENPNLKAESEDYRNTVRYSRESRRFYYSSGNAYIPVMSDKWRMIKPEPKEVEFMVAMRAFKNGKTIYCIIAGEKFIYLGYTRKLIDQKNDPITTTEITDGKWYVEVGG
jgi:hypothetical protein